MCVFPKRKLFCWCFQTNIRGVESYYHFCVHGSNKRLFDKSEGSRVNQAYMLLKFRNNLYIHIVNMFIWIDNGKYVYYSYKQKIYTFYTYFAASPGKLI